MNDYGKPLSIFQALAAMDALTKMAEKHGEMVRGYVSIPTPQTTQIDESEQAERDRNPRAYHRRKMKEMKNVKL